MRLVLLDENIETYEVLKDVASLSQSEVVYFKDIEEAKKFIEENKDIDGIISEVYIDGKPAVQLVAHIKALSLDIPLIILTDVSQLSEDDLEYFKTLGITKVMEKPFNPLEVLTEVVAYLQKTKGEEYVKERLHEDTSDRSSLKILVEKLIEFLKKLFSRK